MLRSYAHLAEDLGIAKDQVPLALRALQETSAIEDSEEAAKFRKRLTKDLSVKARSIIGPNIEARILESAKRKYSLSATEAMTILRSVLQELGMQRITDDDVYAHILASIDATVGDAVYVRNVQRENLLAAAAQWGIKTDEVDELIEQKLETNRRKATRQQRRTIAAILMGLAAVVMTVVVVFLVWFRRGNVPIAEGSPSEVATSGGAPDKGSPLAEFSPPAFWDVDLTIEVARLRTDSPAVSSIYPGLCKPEPGERGVAYQKLAETSLASDTPAKVRQAILLVLGRLVVLESDDGAALSTGQSFVKRLPNSGGIASATQKDLNESFLSGRSLTELIVASASKPARQASLIEQTNTQLDLALTTTNFADAAAADASQRQITLQIVRRLAEGFTLASKPLPTTTVEIIDALVVQANAAGMEASESKDLRERVLITLTTQGQVGIPGYRRFMETVVPAMDASMLATLADSFEALATSPEKAQLAKQLALRAKLSPMANDEEILAGIRSLAGIEPAPQSSSDRWRQLQVLSRDLLKEGLPTRSLTANEQLKKCVRVARLHTLAFVLACSPSGEVQFDNLSKGYFEETPASAESAPKEEAAGTAIAAEKPRNQTAKEHKDLEDLCARLHNFATQKPLIRSNLFRGISHIGMLDPGVSSSQATELARYLVCEKSDEELQSLLDAVRVLGKRVEMRLALLDRWHECKLTPAQRVAVLQCLVPKERSLGIPTIDATDSEVRYWLLTSTAKLLDNGLSEDKEKNEVPQAESFQASIAETISDRGLSLGSASMLGGLDPASTSVSQMMAATLLAWNSSHEATNSGQSANLARRVRLARQMAADDLSMTLYLQRIWMEEYREAIGIEQGRPLVLPVEVTAKLDSWSDKPQNDLAQFYAAELTCLEGLMKLHGQNIDANRNRVTTRVPSAEGGE